MLEANACPKPGARRSGGLAQQRLQDMIYGEVLAINFDGCAHLESTPDRWGRSGVRPAPVARTGRR